MRVAIVSPSYLAAENAKNVAALAAYADVRVVSPDRGLYADAFADLIERPTGAVRSLYQFYPLKRLGRRIVLLDSRDFGFRAFRPDIVQVEHEPWSAIFWQALRRQRAHAPDARFIVLLKKNTYRRHPGLAGALKTKLGRLGLARTHHMIAASRMTARLYQSLFGYPAARQSVVHHLGVDVDTFRPAPPGMPVGEGLRVGYVGRLAAHKGVTDLVEAVAEARRMSGLDLRLDLLGEGELWGALQRQSEAEPWIAVHRTVPQAQVADFLRLLDIFVLPARVLPDHEEHDAHALMEALACGLPCVGTESGIIPEILGDGTGFLVRPSRPDRLADVILALAGDPARRTALGVRGRSKAMDAFSLDAVAVARMKVYRHALAAA